MRLYVYVLEGKDLPVKDVYVKVRVGKLKSKTRTLRNSMNPIWNEEFVFSVHDMDQEVVVSVLHHDDNSRLFTGSTNLMGRIRFPVSYVAAEDNRTLTPTWFPLETTKTGKFITRDRGKILLTMSLHGKMHDASTNHFLPAHSDVNIFYNRELEGPCASSHDILSCKAPYLKIAEGKHLVKAFASRLEKLFNKDEEMSRSDDSSEISSMLSDYEDCIEGHPPTISFEEALEMIKSKDNGQGMLDNLLGGIILDQSYIVSPKDLNKLLFAPDSQFRRDLAALQGTTDVQEGAWTWKSADMSQLTRLVTYTKAATKLVKAVQASEEQNYIRANRREFAIFISVSTPEVPYGGTFKIELLYQIMPGPELPSGAESSHLVVSWGINFHQSTMMKGMIEGGARQGLKESFDQFAHLLEQNFKVPDSIHVSDKDHLIRSLQTEHQSDRRFALDYFWNFSIISTFFMIMYVFVHILFCEPSKVQGLEFSGLDLPDSFGQLITSGILVLQLERGYDMISHFIQARLERGSDHGVKAQGDGWILTVALVEGTNLASLDPTGFSDPYVVFTCNGKTKTSSVDLQTRDPQWNEIFEFDAMEEPPSVLDVEVFDFDGPFDLATSLGHTEINFLTHSSTDLADLWVSLEGKLAQTSQSKLHLRIFLDNNNGIETMKEYLTKMEKKVGKKLSLRSPHRNSAFQKLFSLPTEEFLMSDFSCCLKRKLPLQGRIYLSARIVGFYANLFGHKTKFFFLWEDIEDIQIFPASLPSLGSPSLVIILRKGRGLDARHGAKSQDEEGRLGYYFQSFASFNIASRTIMALWRTRTLTPEERAQIAKEQQDEEESSIEVEDVGSFLFEVEESKMSKVYAAEVPMNIKSLMEIFNGGVMEHKIMEKSGCLNYATTDWEPVKPGVLERCLSYKFNRHISIFGVEVTSTQHKSSMTNDEGYIVNEVMVLHDIPFGDHFHVHLRYQIKKSALAGNVCKCDVFVGISWLKSTKFQQRITRNIIEKFTHRMKEIFELVEKEILFATQQDNSI